MQGWPFPESLRPSSAVAELTLRAQAAWWYLLTGTVFHMLMDGLVGLFHQLPLMDALFLNLSSDFNRPFGKERASIYWLVGCLGVLQPAPSQCYAARMICYAPMLCKCPR